MNKITNADLFTIICELSDRIDLAFKQNEKILSKLEEMNADVNFGLTLVLDEFEDVHKAFQADLLESLGTGDQGDDDDDFDFAQMRKEAHDRLFFSTDNLSEIARNSVEQVQEQALESAKTCDAISETITRVIDEIRPVRRPVNRRFRDLVAAGKL